MNNVIWSLLITSIAGFSTLLGCIALFFKLEKYEKIIVFSISLSISVMIMLSILELIPNAIFYLMNLPNTRFLLTFILFFFSGFLLVTLLDYLINHFLQKGSANLLKVGILNFLALIIHNIPEGILTFLGTYQDIKLGFSLCLAIALHNIPEGISIAVPIYYSTKSKLKAFLIVLLAAVAEPIGALLAFIGLKNFISNYMISCLLVFTAGIMITISINKLFPIISRTNKKIQMYSGFLIGIIVIILSLIL